jgi:type IV pilus assembly protein PilO
VKRRLTTRTLGLLVTVGLLVYGAGGYFLVVSPKKSAAAGLETEIAAANVELMTARAAAAPQGGDTQPIAVADIFRLAKAMPANPDMPGILLELSRIAEETGISFTSITPQASTASTGYQVVPISVTFDGSFYALSDLLFRLRTLVSVRRGELHATGRLFAVQGVDFTESSEGFPELTASLTLNAYVYGTDTPANELPPATEAPPAEGAEVPPPDDAETAEASG